MQIGGVGIYRTGCVQYGIPQNKTCHFVEDFQ